MHEEALLAQASVLWDKHEALAAASGQSFNLFAILGQETDEVHTHSAILAELLDPNGSHRQGSAFARLFAGRFHISDSGIENARVWCEETVSKGSRTDILMQIGGDTCIVIENKIHADDQPGQLERYQAYARRWTNWKVFYLTLHGDTPSEESLGGLSPDDVKCISYQVDVIGWLDDCVKHVARVPQIREILAHYQALLRKLTGTSTGELTMDLQRLLANKQGAFYNFEVVPAIAEAMTSYSVAVEWKFWHDLKEQLRAKEGHPWRFTPIEGIAEGSNPKEVSEDIVRHAHSRGRNRWHYGWTFKIDSDGAPERYYRDGIEVMLRVECDRWGWGFYGLIAVGNTTDGRCQLCRSEHLDGLFDEWGQRMEEIDDRWHTDGEWWLAWAWPTANVDLRKTMWLAPDVIRAFVEDDGVGPLVDDICRTMDRIEGCSH